MRIESWWFRACVKSTLDKKRFCIFIHGFMNKNNSNKSTFTITIHSSVFIFFQASKNLCSSAIHYSYVLFIVELTYYECSFKDESTWDDKLVLTFIIFAFKILFHLWDIFVFDKLQQSTCLYCRIPKYTKGFYSKFLI